MLFNDDNDDDDNDEINGTVAEGSLPIYLRSHVYPTDVFLPFCETENLNACQETDWVTLMNA